MDEWERVFLAGENERADESQTRAYTGTRRDRTHSSCKFIIQVIMFSIVKLEIIAAVGLS
jgi:hypothetical protein